MFERLKVGQKVSFTCYGENYANVLRQGEGVVEQKTSATLHCICRRECHCHGIPMLLVRDSQDGKVYGLLNSSEVRKVG